MSELILSFLWESFFGNVISQDVFCEWIKSNDFIDPILVSRQEWNNIYCDNFLLDDWDQKKLYIPIDMKFYEFLAIFEKINLSVEIWNESYSFDSVRHIVRWWLTKILSKSRSRKRNTLDMFSRYYVEKSWIASEQELENNQAETNKSDIKKFNQLMIQRWYDPKDLDSIKQFIFAYVEEFFIVVLFLKWLKNITENKTNFSLIDLPKFLWRDLSDDSKESLWNNILLENLSWYQLKLRDILNIDNIREKLKEARNKWLKNAAMMIERNFISNLISEINKFPWNMWDTVSSWSTPLSILCWDYMICVWKAIIAAAFLREVWITYHVLNVPNHISLYAVLTNWTKFLVDPTWFNKPYDITEKPAERIWAYYRIKLTDDKVLLINQSDYVWWLISSLMNNMGLAFSQSWKIDIAKKMFDYAIWFDPNHFEPYHNRWCCYEVEWDYLAASKDFWKAISMYPLAYDNYFKYASSLYNIWQIEDALIFINTYLESNLNDIKWVFLRWCCYLNLWNIKDWLNDINQVISELPDFERSYFERWYYYFSIKDYQRALSDFLEAEKKWFNDVENFLLIWECYYHTWSKQKAIEYFKKANSIDLTVRDLIKQMFDLVI